MVKEFKEFLEKFKVIPIAIAFVLATAFAPVVEAFVELILSVIAKATGGDVSAGFATLEVADIVIGPVISALITFILIALVVFLIIKGLNKAGTKTDAGVTPDQALLTEIRDLLRAGR